MWYPVSFLVLTLRCSYVRRNGWGKLGVVDMSPLYYSYNFLSLQLFPNEKLKKNTHTKLMNSYYYIAPIACNGGCIWLKVSHEVSGMLRAGAEESAKGSIEENLLLRIFLWLRAGCRASWVIGPRTSVPRWFLAGALPQSLATWASP